MTIWRWARSKKDAVVGRSKESKKMEYNARGILVIQFRGIRLDTSDTYQLYHFEWDNEIGGCEKKKRLCPHILSRKQERWSDSRIQGEALKN